MSEPIYVIETLLLDFILPVSGDREQYAAHSICVYDDWTQTEYKFKITTKRGRTITIMRRELGRTVFMSQDEAQQRVSKLHAEDLDRRRRQLASLEKAAMIFVADYRHEQPTRGALAILHQEKTGE